MSHYDESPINPLPPVVMLLSLAIVLPELAFQLGERGLIGGPEAVGWRLAMVNRFAFVDGVFDQMVARRVWPPEHLARFVTYPFVHASFVQAVFALVFVLALGKMVGERFSGLAVLVVFFGASIFAALVYGTLLDEDFPLFGGFPPAYGLIGAYTFLYWLKQVATGGPQTQAFMLIVLLMGIQLVFGLLFGPRNDWVADLAGFVAGFGLSFLVVPGGAKRLVTWLRDR